MPIDPQSPIVITTFDWVPEFARGYVRDLRPRWACEELGLSYAVRTIPVRNRPAEYFKLQPFGQAPAMHDGEIAMFETGAMLFHLAEKAPGLLPADGQARCDTMTWLFAALNSIEPMNFELTRLGFAGDAEWATLRRPSLLEMVSKRLSLLSDALGGRDWFSGQFSIAEIAMVTVLRELDDRGVLGEFADLRAYVERGTSRPAFQTALAAQIALIDANEPKKQEA